MLAKLINARVRPFLPDLVHTSLTSFVQDQCILDNLFCFHQEVEWARAFHTPLAILLLDFEKAYDRVDLDFLEGSLLRLVFSDALIRGVSALYRLAFNAMTIGGCVGRSFALPQSIREGCPLAPYLFLFVGETMSDFLRAQQPALLMPAVDELDLVDQEYAEDTLLFLGYTSDVLDTIRHVLDVYCVASGARINWHKSYGILVGSEEISIWKRDGFAWLRHGQTCRYVGFQVGVDVSLEQQFSLSCNLCIEIMLLVLTTSFLGRPCSGSFCVDMVASCWTLHTGVMAWLRQLIRSFLFGGFDGSRDTSA
ncbi:hypothetical protein L7F22_033817 [Adiantum nelumboides]|nr:hypothetical protein [Adiantum nelumboides]